MIESTANFYRNTVADLSIANGQTIRSPLTRLQFMSGAGLSTAFLVHSVILSIFFLLANIFTLFCNADLRSSLFQNVQEIPTYALGIPFGYAGVLFPETMNRLILQTPENQQALRV